MNSSNSRKAASSVDLGQLRLRYDGQESRWSIHDLDADTIDLQPLEAGGRWGLAPRSRVELIFPATAVDPAFAVAAEVLESSGNQLQLSLHSLDDDQLRAIRNRVHGRQGAVPGDARERTLELIERRLRGPVAGRLRLLIDEAESDLRPGTQTELHWRGAPARQVRQLLAERAADLVEAFTGNALKPWLGAPANPSSGVGRRPALRLVDDDEMSVWLARSEALRAMERQTRGAWFKLTPALSVLFGDSADADLEAISGEALIDAWLQALKACDCEPELQRLLIALFARHDVFDLSAFYVELRQDLQRNGLLFETAQSAPILRQPVHSRRSTAAAPVGADAGKKQAPLDSGAQPGETVVAAAGGNWSLPPTAGGTAEGWGPVAAPEALSVARKLWHLGPIPDDLPLQAADEQRPAIEDQALLQALREVLQQSPSEGQDYAGFIRAVAEQAQGDSKQHIATDERQSEALALLARLHSALAGDQIVPEGFDRWSRPLIAPLFGAQLSPEGLAQSGDEVRKLFELIEFGSVLVAERKDQSGKQIQQGIDEVVERLAAAPELSADLVSGASKELDRLLQRHRKAAVAIEDRVVEACVGQQRLIDARRVVDASLNSSFLGIEVPAAWIRLLEQRLVPLMVLSVLRQGPDSAEWQAVEQQMDKFAQDFVALREQRPPGRPVEDVLAWIRLFLNEAEVGGAGGENPTLGLASAWAGEPTEWQPYRSVLAHVLNEPKAKPQDQQLDRLAQQVDVLQPGDWLTFKSRDGRPRALKLAWHAPDHARFVFVSQLGHKADDMEREQLLEAMRLGDVKVLEDGQSSIIERAWRRMMESMHDQLAAQATNDALTGLLNRKELERRLGLWLRGRQREPLLVLWMGVDHMRRVNDAHGLEAGDHVLAQMGKLLLAECAECGADAEAARIAGDEFVLVLPQTDGSEAEARANHVLRALSEFDWSFNGHQLPVTVSIGVCIADQNCSSIETLMRDAEHACRAAKESGGDRIYLHHVDDFRLAQMRETFQWVGKVEQSLEAQTLVLFGQRAKALSARAIMGGDYVEVLLRMRDQGGYASPENFIVAAERYGQIAAIDRFVLNDLVRCLNAAKRQDKLRIAFNVSGRNITDAEFVDEIVRVLAEQPWPMSQLCVELTETAAIQQLADASLAMRRLSAAGVSMVLDDFGSGWASYQYLRRLPFDVVKVDGAFIRDIGRSAEDLALARSINEVAHVLGKMTVAEHVEDEEILRLVQEIGFDYAQGYAVAKPVPLDELLRGGA